MEKHLLAPLLEEAKKDKRLLESLKKLAVDHRQYEVGANLRDLEKEIFPPRIEELEAKADAIILSAAFRLVDLNISNDNCWLIAAVVRRLDEKKDNFSLSDAIEIMKFKKQYFGE